MRLDAGEVEHAPVAAVSPSGDHQMTSGSQSISSSWDQLRMVGPERGRCWSGGGQRWKVPWPSAAPRTAGRARQRQARHGQVADAANKLPLPTG
jgi:hypothetical protein